MAELKIDVTLTRVGVNMGDHGQDVVNALDASDDTTIRELAEKALTHEQVDWLEPKGTDGERPRTLVADNDNYITIRIAKSLEEDQ